MPPFSGKKKKEQLQAKRQRKREEEERDKVRDREREQLREQLTSRGEDASDDVLDAVLRERADLQDPARGRRARRRERESAAAAAATSGSAPTAGHHRVARGRDTHGSSSGSSSSSSGDSGGEGSSAHDASRRPGAAAAGSATMMYSADRQHGVRSVFVKESAAELAARRQLSYQPIPCRTTIPASGIPFGEWFTFPTAGASAKAQNARRGRGSAEEAREGVEGEAEAKLAAIAAEQQRRMQRPLVASAGDALGGVSSSAFFPIAVELPSRGWRVRAADGGGGLSVEPLTLVAAAGGDGGSGAAALASAARSAEPVQQCGSSASDSEAGSGNDTSEAGGAAAGVLSREDASYLKQIEQTRFSAYAGCVDAYPFPEPLRGLEVSSYERNVEVWQQLWRTVEMSDVLVIVADARYPIIHAHLGLLTYIAKEQRKPCVFVLNKEDLVPASTLRCWQEFLHRYLDDLGFAVEPPAAVVEATRDSESGGGSRGTGLDLKRGGRIVLRTFTANPRPETAGQRDGDVDVTRRQKNRKKANAHVYEKLRTGRLNVAKHLGGSGDDEGDDEDEDDGLQYGETENFVGMRAAQHALQQDKRAYKELEVVAAKIAELLQTCRRLGEAARGGRGGAATEATPALTAEGSPSTYATSSLPCAAPRAARKGKGAQKKGAGSRQGGGGRPRFSDPADGDGSGRERGSGGDDDDDDPAVERAPDSPSYLHIGVIGHPNVGKSSLLNCIRGTKMVSVSATPGHTKHIQTIPVPEEGVTLVDSPGLALPVFGVPRPLQAVLGTHQIAQTRDPQTGISFLAAYLPIEKTYGLLRPEYAMQEEGWSSYELCEAYAKKRGFFVKHGKGALDIHRAAIALLQEAYEGRLSLFYAAPELNLLQSTWYRERVRPYLLLPIFKPTLLHAPLAQGAAVANTTAPA